MFILLLCSAFIRPCLTLPLSASSLAMQGVAYHELSAAKAYVEPKLGSLDKCQSAKMGVFFHENFTAAHTADYIPEGIELSTDRTNISHIISPISSSLPGENAHDILDVHTQDLSYILQAHGVNAIMPELQIQPEFNSLSTNGITAILKITISNGDSDSV